MDRSNLCSTICINDMMEVTLYFQTVSVSQSHLIEILCGFASGPLWAERDAYLAVSDLGLREQAIFMSTIN